MKTFLFLLVVFCSFTITLFTQNLVQNYSLEDVSSDFQCGHTAGMNQSGIENFWSKVSPWTVPEQKLLCISPVGSTDCLCEANFARTGNNYAWCAGREEYLTAPLSSSLIKNHRYYVEFYVKGNNTSTQNGGIRFSKERPKQCGSGIISIDGDPHVEIDNNLYLTFSSWAKVSSIYIADDNYSWLTFGTYNEDKDFTQGFFVDDFRIYDLGADCQDDILIENFTYDDMNVTIKAANTITAGYDVGAPTANGDVLVKANSDVNYRAGSSITLLPGFSTESGSTFTAVIEPCSLTCPPISINIQPNVFTPNGDAVNDQLCFDVTGAENYDITIQSPSGSNVYVVNGGTVSGSTACVWDGHCNTGIGCVGQLMQDGTYYMVGTFSNCLHTISFDGFFSLLDGSGKKEKETETMSTKTGDPTITNNFSSAITISPNPNNGNFTISLNILLKNSELQIRDVLGNLVKSLKTSASTIEIDLSAQPKGVYFVKIISEQGEVLGVKKVVVQ